MRVVILLLSIFVYQTNEPPKDLVLTGHVRATRCKPAEQKYISCKIDLSLEFINQGKQPIIILRPYGQFEFFQGGSALALSKTDSEAYHYIYDRQAWPSIYRGEDYRQFAEALDQPAPAANLTRVLAPGQSWKWETTTSLTLNEENTRGGLRGTEIGWKEVKKRTAPVWLRVSFEMWPFNVENFKKDLGGKLRKRWAKYGVLYLEEKSGPYWFAHLTSEPIELDFRSVELK